MPTFLLLDITNSSDQVTWVITIFVAVIVLTLVVSNIRLSSKLKESESFKIREAKLLFEQWKILHEAEIREDAVKRSTAVHLGRITEHLLPFMSGFPYDTKDVRFIGSPIDLIIFDGHSEQKDEITIIMTEIKTGKSRMSATQKKIKEAVLNKRIQWWEIRVDDYPKQSKNIFN